MKKYCRSARIEPGCRERQGIEVRSFRKTAINNAIRNSSGMNERCASSPPRPHPVVAPATCCLLVHALQGYSFSVPPVKQPSAVVKEGGPAAAALVTPRLWSAHSSQPFYAFTFDRTIGTNEKVTLREANKASQTPIAGHVDIRTTEVYFVRKEEDAEVAARRIQIRVTGKKEL
jgi:hypothetical protein